MPDPSPLRAAPFPPNFPHAFPRALRADASALTRADVWYAQARPSRFTVMFAGEPLAIPIRLYVDHMLLWSDDAIGARQHAILWCLGTRHHSGYVREKCVRELLAAPQPWMAPFVVHLIGEYVVEIVALIDAALSRFDPPVRAAFADFVRDNPRYIDRIEQRTMSYWSCYYRHLYPDRGDYPGTRALATLRRLATPAHR